MTRKDILLTILIEECSEVIQDVTKSLRFGLQDHWKDNSTNLEKLQRELSDLQGIVEMLIDEEILLPIPLNWIHEKKVKIDKYLEYSKMVGRLEE